MKRIIRSLALFQLRLIKLVVKPYETYREIVESGSLEEIGWIGSIITVYFLFATIVKTPFFRLFLMTKQWLYLLGATGITFVLVIGLLWYIGRALGGKGTVKGVLLGWGYSLLPTLVWFLMTSLLYILLPPPRTQSGLGILFSSLYLLISVTLLFWKMTLAYLTLRFGLRLDLKKIVVVGVIVLPILGAYSVLLYRLGLFRIPFI